MIKNPITIAIIIILATSLIVYMNIRIGKAKKEPVRIQQEHDKGVVELDKLFSDKPIQQEIVVLKARQAELQEAIKLEELSANPVAIVEQAPPVISTVRQRNFSKGSGSSLIDTVKNNPNGRKLWDAFNQKYGEEIADTSAVALMYENGTMLATTTGVCNRKYQINGDYRNCVYADINSAGMDAGLKQINTYWQRYRIAKLGGPSCEPQNSRDITDPCTASQVEWLKNVDNNIMIALDIYNEQGFTPWYGYKKAFNQ